MRALVDRTDAEPFGEVDEDSVATGDTDVIDTGTGLETGSGGIRCSWVRKFSSVNWSESDVVDNEHLVLTTCHRSYQCVLPEWEIIRGLEERRIRLDEALNMVLVEATDFKTDRRMNCIINDKAQL